ncbi:MAG: hypothetical protein A2173_06375 [Planctomycetes bacterium RBG_13_44_8b]|nr:MAG: hypothetical protein A2173_06375 [Planctomycetes bacterium RBG_13_44_8b]
MLDLSPQVQNEGFCLLRLCKDLREFILSGKTRKTYLLETKRFLKYITKSLEAIDSFVRQAVKQEIDPPLLKSKLREFDSIKKVLAGLYVLTEEAVDADTLSIPYSLTIFLNHTAKIIEKPKKVALVVIGSSDLMYYKYNLKRLRKLSTDLSIVIKDYPPLPEDIGVLKFPYCAAQEVLANCVLFHEMGHYIYENTKLEQDFFSDI